MSEDIAKQVLEIVSHPDTLDFTAISIQNRFVLEYGYRPNMKLVYDAIYALEQGRFIQRIKNDVIGETPNDSYIELNKEKIEKVIAMWKSSHKEKQFSTLSNVLYGAGFAEDLISIQNGKKKNDTSKD